MKTKLPDLKQVILVNKDMEQYQEDLDFLENKVFPRLGDLNMMNEVVLENLSPGVIRILKENNYPIRVDDGVTTIFKSHWHLLISHWQIILAVSLVVFCISSIVLAIVLPFATGNPFWILTIIGLVITVPMTAAVTGVDL